MRRMIELKIIEDGHFNFIIMFLYLCGKKSKMEIYCSISLNPQLPYKFQVPEEEIITITREGGRPETSGRSR